MKMPVLEPTSAAKSGWLIILLTVGWLGFVLWPWPKDKPAATPRAIPMPATSLTRAGLAEYTDWAGLPEIFAIWDDKAEWKDGKTRFAYWHPVMKNYSYYFEAVRVASGFRFKEIAEPKDSGYDWDESLGDECPIRFYRSTPTPETIHFISVSFGKSIDGPFMPEAPKRLDPIKPPPPELKLQPLLLEQKH